MVDWIFYHRRKSRARSVSDFILSDKIWKLTINWFKKCTQLTIKDLESIVELYVCWWPSRLNTHKYPIGHEIIKI